MDAAWIGLLGVGVGAIATTGGTLITGYFAGRRAAKAALLESRTGAYSAFIASCGLIAFTATEARLIIATRSGIVETARLLTGSHKPVDPEGIIALFRHDLDPLYQSWSNVWTVGSREAITLANEVLDQVSLLIAKGSEPGKARGPLGTTLRGHAWTNEQQAAFQAELERLAILRRDFTTLARQETGHAVVEFFRAGASPFS